MNCSNFIYPLAWDLLSWGEHEMQVIWDLKNHFIAVLVQQKYWDFLFYSLFIFLQKYILAIRTILAQPKTSGIFAFSKILSGAMMCVFCQLKFTGIVNHRDFLRRSSHMLCLGFLIFLLAAVTFSSTTKLQFESSANNFSSRKQLKHFDSVPLKQGKKL